MAYYFYKLFFICLIFFNSDACFNSGNNSEIILKEDLIINSSDIGKVNEIQIDGTGQIYISDGINQCIHLYSSKGKFIRKIGRKGEAPGEFQYIWGIKITRGDTLVVYDGILYRITIYAPGKFDSPIKTIRIPAIENEPDRPGVIGNLYSGISGLWLPQNNSKEFLIIYNVPYSLNDLTQKQKHYSKLYLIDNKGRLIKKKPILTLQDVERLQISSGSGFMVSDMPFGRKPVICLNKNGIIYYAETNDLKITAIDLYGKKKNEISYKIDKIFIRDKLWQDELEENYNLTLKDIRKSKMPLPEYLPVFDDFTIDDDNNIWVAVNEKDYRSYKYYVFDNQGKLISIVPILNKTVIKVVNKSFAYGINTDNRGIQSVIRYKVERK
ncbi:6-bladed beta-propeller [Melioribacteraceae bacterium 4301-Me]|uniref:6-bladed beta-propeller n=1 Tax=Pyranulibacter aquaticus TaxID=3163344 RepID=UPI00359B4FEB